MAGVRRPPRGGSLRPMRLQQPPQRRSCTQGLLSQSRRPGRCILVAWVSAAPRTALRVMLQEGRKALHHCPSVCTKAAEAAKPSLSHQQVMLSQPAGAL